MHTTNSHKNEEEKNTAKIGVKHQSTNQSKKDKTEKLPLQGTQDGEKQNKSTNNMC